MHSKIGSFINVFSVRLSRSNLAFGIYKCFSLLRFGSWSLTYCYLSFTKTRDFLIYTSFRDCSRNQNLSVLSSKHSGHIWKVRCQLPKIVYRELTVIKTLRNVYRGMGFQPFSSYRNCMAIFFLFQRMFYRIHSLGSYERISSRKHQAGPSSSASRWLRLTNNYN